jgi:cytochrome c553
MRYALIALTAANVHAAGGDAKAGEAKAVVCMACHGPQGNSSNPDWPKLAGQHDNYIVKQLQAFKAGTRKDPLMSAQAMALSDADMNNLAAYFATQTQK